MNCPQASPLSTHGLIGGSGRGYESGQSHLSTLGPRGTLSGWADWQACIPITMQARDCTQGLHSLQVQPEAPGFHGKHCRPGLALAQPRSLPTPQGRRDGAGGQPGWLRFR